MKKYMVTYNNTEEFFVFKDRYFSTLAGANRFYDKMYEECKGKVTIKDVENNTTVREVGLKGKAI